MINSKNNIQQKGTIFLKDVSTLDCAVFDGVQAVKGMTWLADIYISGDLDANRFVWDFGEAKKLVKETIDEFFDHVLIIPIEAPNLRIQEFAEGKDLKLTINIADNLNLKSPLSRLEYSAPKSAIAFISGARFTREMFEETIASKIRSVLPKNIYNIKVQLHEEMSASDNPIFFHYTHGLAGHRGACQRLLHGHRSKLEVRIDGMRDESMEKWLVSDVLQGSIHIGTHSQIITQDDASASASLTEPAKDVVLGYRGTQGNFKLQIPSSQVLFVESETSVECLADFLYKKVKEKVQSRNVSVTVFEGVNKGSISEDTSTS